MTGISSRWRMNAHLPFADAVAGRLVFPPRFPLRGGCHRVRIRLQPDRDLLRRCRVRLRWRSARFRHQSRSHQDHHREFAAGVAGRLRQPLVVDRGRILQPGDGQHTRFDSYVRDYADTPSFEYYADYELELSGNTLAPTDTLVPRSLRHRARSEGGVRRAVLRCHRALHDHGRRALVRL